MAVNANQILDEMAIPLKSFVAKRISNKQDAEEITQEALLKIYNGLKGLKDNSKLHAWIYRITRNEIIDYYRKNSKAVEIVELYDGIDDGSGEDQNSNKEIAGCLSAMIENLPDKYRQAILLTELEHLINKELARQLGISLSGAKSRVQRARRMLKEMLTCCCSLEFDSLGNIIDYKHKTSECRYC